MSNDEYQTSHFWKSMKKSELKQIIREEVSKTLTELEPQNPNPFYVLGFEVGPNARKGVDPNSKEAKTIIDKVDLPMIQLEKDKDVVEFAKGYIDSISSRGVQYDGIKTIAPLLLKLKKKGWPKPGYVL